MRGKRSGRTSIGGRIWDICGAALALGAALAVVSCQGSGEASKGGAVEEVKGVTAVNVGGVDSEPVMRVRVLQKQDSVRFSGPTWFRFRVEGKPERRVPGPFTAAFDGLNWTVSDVSGSVVNVPGGGEAVVEGDQSGEGTVWVNGVKYSGTFVLMPRSADGAGGFDVVERVGLETYLEGVLAAELYKDWPLTAFQVQAICARSYAIHEKLRQASTGGRFDVESTVKDQAYGGASGLAVAREAVKSTRGVVMTYAGGVLRTYYSSTCGGRPGSANATWPVGKGYEYNLNPPLQGKPRGFACEESPLYRWRVTRGIDDLTARMTAWGKNAGNGIKKMKGLRGVAVAETNAAARPTRYVVTDGSGQRFPLTAEELRRACNEPVPGFAEITRENRVSSGDMEWAFAGSGGSVTISGRGFGHGVGMCQYCVKGFADRGEGWRAVIEKFYPTAHVSKVY